MCAILNCPKELIHKISDFLSIDDVNSLKNTCQLFFNIFDNHEFWHRRFLVLKPLNLSFPRLTTCKVNWKKTTKDYESFHHKLYRFGNSDVQKFRSTELGLNIIDAIHLPKTSNNLIIAGDRGYSLLLFSIKNIANGSWAPIISINEHKGWIWSIQSHDKELITGSWDSTLIHWHLGPSNTSKLASYNLGSPVLCTGFLSPNTCVCGSYKDLFHVDFREPVPVRLTPLNSFHKNSVLCLQTVTSSYSDIRYTPSFNCGLNSIEEFGDDSESLARSLSTLSLFSELDESLKDIPEVADPDFHPNTSSKNTVEFSNPCPGFSFFTGSKDHFICAWDMRKSSIPVSKYQCKNYPRLMSLCNNSELWVCESPNALHLFDIRHHSMNNDDSFTPQMKLISTSNMQSSNKSRGFGCLKATSTAIFLGMLQGDFDIYNSNFSPTNLDPRNSLVQKMEGSPLCVDYLDETLVVGSGHGEIYLWISKTKLNSLLNVDIV